MNTKDELLYGCFDRERLHESTYEAIEEYLDGEDVFDIVSDPGYSIEVREYRRVTAHLDPQRILDYALEYLDGNYAIANEDGPSEPTDAMREAAKVFCAAILSEYVPYDCMPTGKREMINVLEWVRKNAPEWLERDDHE